MVDEVASLMDQPRPLPTLRSDVQVCGGVSESGGSPTITLLDPTSGKYHKLGWAESLIIKHLRPGMTTQDLIRTLEKTTTLRPTAVEIEIFFQFLAQANLLERFYGGRAAEFSAKRASQRKGIISTLLSHYLYIRLPLCKPDPFLRRYQWFFDALSTRTMLVVYGLCLVMGMVLVAPRSAEYFGTFLRFFTPLGAFYYGLALVLIKTIHEFAHGFMAIKMGTRVRTMGVAFIVFWPIPYCDVTDAWSIPSKKKRALIAAAGMIVEVAIAGSALVVWALTPPGVVHSLAFVLSSLSLLSSVLMNANPAMRYDGYYLLSDIWGVDNLHKRAIAMGVWKWRTIFIGIDMPPPEQVSKVRSNLLIAFGIYAVVYRFFLYLGIAIMVYNHFTKALGIVLFAIELVMFIILPVIKEIQAIWSLRDRIRRTTSLLVVQSILFAVFLFYTIPLPRVVYIPAIEIPRHTQRVYVPQDSIVKTYNISSGITVCKGQVLVELYSPSLDAELSKARAEIALLESKEMAAIDVIKKRHDMGQVHEALERARSQYKGLQKRAETLRIVADFDGVVFGVNEEIAPGVAVGKQQLLARIASPQQCEVQAYIPEKWVGYIADASRCTFIPRGSGPPLRGVINHISSVRMQYLSTPSLAHIYGGAIAVHQDRSQRLQSLDTWYPVRCTFDSDQTNTMQQHLYQSGELRLYSSWYSPLYHGIRYAFMMLVKQTGF